MVNVTIGVLYLATYWVGAVLVLHILVCFLLFHNVTIFFGVIAINDDVLLLYLISSTLVSMTFLFSVCYCNFPRGWIME